MNNQFFRKAGVVFSALFSALLLTTCVKIDDLTDGVVLYFDADIVDNAATIQFVDANPDVSGVPDNIDVKIEGPGADKLFSLLGEKAPKASGNFLAVGVEKSLDISETNPLVFTVIASAPGYLEGIQKFEITSKEDLEFEFPLVSKNNPPQGVSMATPTFQAPAAGLPAPQSFMTPMTPGKQEMAMINMPQGVKLQDANGNVLSGTVQAELVHYDTRSSESINAFPGGLDFEMARGPGGQMIENGMFETAGFFSLDMTVGGQEVKTFDQPVEVCIELQDDLVNPETGQVMQAGEKIPVWSLNDETGEWEYEGDANVQLMPNGKLAAVFMQTHLSWWNLDWFYTQRCRTRVNFASSLTRQTASRYFVFEFTAYDNRGRLVRKYPRYFKMYNGQTVNLYNVPNLSGQNRYSYFEFKVYDVADYRCPSPSAIWESSQLTNICGGLSVNLGSRLETYLNPPTSVRATFTFSGMCEDLEIPVAILPSVPVYYTNLDDCRPRRRYLTTLRQGKATFRALVPGQSYDFSINYVNFRSLLRNVTIPTQSTNLSVTEAYSGITETIQFNYSDSTNLQIIYETNNLPESMCEEIRKLTGG